MPVGAESIVMTSLKLKSCVHVPDDFQGYSKESFCIPPHYRESIDRVLIPHGQIQDRVEKIATDIFHQQAGRPMATLCVLKGGYKFYTDLLNKLNELNGRSPYGQGVPMTVDFIRCKSYVNTSSGDEINITGAENLDKTLKGKVVLLAEDIVDTGRSMKKLLDVLWSYEPAQIIVACLLRKRTPKSNGFAPDHVGFEIPDKFVIGYALDYNEVFRDLCHVCVISQHGIEKYKK